MRYLIIYLLSLLTGFLYAQPNFDHENFEAQALAYAPEQRSGVSDESYAFGTMVLSETIRQTDNDPKAFNVADYFNVMISLISLQESEADIRLAWQKFLKSEDSCEYLIDKGMKEDFFKSPKLAYLKENWATAEANCLNEGAVPKILPEPESYAAEHSLNVGLVKLIAQINRDDQRHRKSDYDPTKQTPLDRRNEKLIEELFEQYGTYLGTSLVGEAYNSVMWSVIQHSRPVTMERYLPIVHRAVQAGELPESPLCMLIDRIKTHKTGKQVFGSQMGVPLLSKAKRNRIKRQYGIK
jgi:hypothetical protein